MQLTEQFRGQKVKIQRQISTEDAVFFRDSGLGKNHSVAEITFKRHQVIETKHSLIDHIRVFVNFQQSDTQRSVEHGTYPMPEITSIFSHK